MTACTLGSLYLRGKEIQKSTGKRGEGRIGERGEEGRGEKRGEGRRGVFMHLINHNQHKKQCTTTPTLEKALVFFQKSATEWVTEGLFQLGFLHDFVIGDGGGGGGGGDGGDDGGDVGSVSVRRGLTALKWYLLAAKKGYVSSTSFLFPFSPSYLPFSLLFSFFSSFFADICKHNLILDIYMKMGEGGWNKMRKKH